jgi:hypothetical protein
MEKQLFELISIDRDAIATNRGFYYQYLNVAAKWVHNYINDLDIDTYTEVDDDLKEVGDELVFTQLKCYSSVFSFTSPEIQKALLNFFALYLQYYSQVDILNFNFKTNTALGKREKLLKAWIIKQPPTQKDVLNLCTSKVSEVLLGQIKKIRTRNLSNKKLSLTDKEILKLNFQKLNNKVQNPELIADFIEKIRWDFGDIQPEESVKALVTQITEQLANPIFEGRPVKLLLEALLSEIYRKSQLSDPKQRKVNNSILNSILTAKDDEFSAYIDIRLAALFNIRLDIIENNIKDIRTALDGTVTIVNEQRELLEKLVKDNFQKKIAVPQYITKIPHIDPSTIVGREDILTKLHEIMSNQQHISINGDGGMGKSTLLKLYACRFKNEYDHIIWLNAGAGLVDSLVVNSELATNLNAPILESDKFSERFDMILGKLGVLPGHNLLIIDGYSKVEIQMGELRSLQNWQIIVGTRLRLQGWKALSINALSFEFAKTLYFSFGYQQNATDSQLKILFNLIDYNTLVIALVARTIHYSFDLSLEMVIKHFEEQSLDAENLHIDLPDESGESLHLLKILNKTFDLSNIEPMDSFYLVFFALLPLEDTNFEDLIDWFGKASEKHNRIALTNTINSLHAKGLIERSGKQITMHKMFRDSILYQERKDEDAFFIQSHNIDCLAMRIKEGADHSLSEALRFLKFGEAILATIKEPYRKAVYRKLLQLENEVLNIYNWINKENDMVARWENLYDRAEKHLPKNDELLGIISNNYGLALATDGKWEQASPQFERAISILQSLDERVLPQLFISLCNLCSLFIQAKDLKRFNDCFDIIQDLRAKHNMWNDISVPIQSQILGSFNYEMGNFPEAIKLYNLAINLHHELPKENKNDAYLVIYFIKLGESYLMNKELDKAEKVATIAISVFSKLNAESLGLLPVILNLVITISELKGDHQKAEKLKEALKNIE